MIYHPRLASHERLRPLHTAIVTTLLLILTFALLQVQIGTYKNAFYRLYLDCMATRHQPGDDAWAMQANLVLCTDIMIYHYSQSTEATP